jgi:hypothetical protein
MRSASKNLPRDVLPRPTLARRAAARPVSTTPPRRRDRSRGQSLAEFAMTVPMALLMVLFGLDFGRVFLGWVALNSAAREAANYAAMNPTAWTIPYNFAVQSEYIRLVETEASSINCQLESPVSAPVFSSGTSIGAPAKVELTCSFGLITPIISWILGDDIPVSADSAFPVRAGLIEGVPLDPTAIPSATNSPAPTASVAPTGSVAPTPTVNPSASVAPSTSPTSSPAPTATPTPTPSPTPATCTVPSLLNIQTNKAPAKWLSAGFTSKVIFSPLVPPNYRILWQSLTVGSTQECTVGITVRSRAP